MHDMFRTDLFLPVVRLLVSGSLLLLGSQDVAAWTAIGIVVPGLTQQKQERIKVLAAGVPLSDAVKLSAGINSSPWLRPSQV